jgi:hypothetical protein
MSMTSTRREFVRTLLAGTAGLSLLPPLANAIRRSATACWSCWASIMRSF